jgi:hypothetical protein
MQEFTFYSFILFVICYVISISAALVFHAGLLAYITLGFFVLWCIMWILQNAEYDCHVLFGLFSCSLIALQFVVFITFWAVANEANPHNPNSPCGSSPCSNIPYQSIVPYHPAGKYQNQTYYYMVCPHPQTCRFADVTGIAPNGYPAQRDEPLLPDVSRPPCNDISCEYLATTRIQDYLGDLAVGLRPGFFEGATTLDLKVCPLVDVFALQPNGIDHGVGFDVCSFCSNYMNRYYGLAVPPNCPIPTTNDHFPCFVCVDASVFQDNYQRQGTAIVAFITCIVSMLFFCANLRAHVSHHKQQQQKLAEDNE